MHARSLNGNREVSGSAVGSTGPDGPRWEGEEPQPPMHDLEKSDSAIVAVKPPNKAGLPVAEAVERRAGAKGNADQQSTHRTQSRIRVTQALSRVRQAAGTSLARPALRRQTPKVGAGCSNWARPDPCGLRLVSAWNSVACDGDRGKA